MKRAYERGRLARALGRGALVLPMLLIALASRQQASHLLPLAALLFAAVLLVSLRGKSAGRAVPLALAAGLAPLLLPLAARGLGHAMCSADCMTSFCLPACYLGGGLAGAALALFSQTEESVPSQREFLISALFISGIAGALGCSMAGAGGVLGMLAAQVALTAPAWRRATS